MTEIKESAPKGKGSFWISKQAIELLLDNEATAMQINAYLVLAKHTNEGGKLSTSGIKAIHTATGVSHPVIEKAVAALMAMTTEAIYKKKKAERLVYSAAEWKELTGEILPPAPFERAEVRYVLNDFNCDDGDKVWLSNELITGIGKFKQPLKRLKMCGDIAARLLLMAYKENNLEQYGGISPQLFFEAYDMENVQSFTGFDIWHGLHNGPTFYAERIKPALGFKKLESDAGKRSIQIKPFWDALKALDQQGFIYQMVSVMDREAGNEDAQVIYELDAKSKHGYKPKGEMGLGGHTARLSGKAGNPVTDSAGRFYGRYAAIVPAGLHPYIVGIYRLRFRVSNPKNYGVTSAWARIHQCQNDALEWIETFAKQTGIELDEVDMVNKDAEPF